VFSRLKTFVSRYTLEMGERITGIPAALRGLVDLVERAAGPRGIRQDKDENPPTDTA
jgi:hypothetical protein